MLGAITVRKNIDIEAVAATGPVDSLALLRHVRLYEVAGLMGCGQRTWLRWVAAGKAPPPVHLGERLVAWRVHDLENWLDQKQRVGGAV